jgi:hypothetical protein
MPRLKPGDLALIKLAPKVISVLDYTKGFGHSELVEVPLAKIRQTEHHDFDPEE